MKQLDRLSVSDVFIRGIAAWRLANLFVNERGPWDAFLRIREAWGIKHDADGNPVAWPDGCPLACMWCTGVWAAIAVVLLPNWVTRILAVAAVMVGIEVQRNGES